MLSLSLMQVITTFADTNRYVLFFAVWNDGGQGEGPVSPEDMLLIFQVSSGSKGTVSTEYFKSGPTNNMVGHC
jgi:hypothetical protein